MVSGRRRLRRRLGSVGVACAGALALSATAGASSLPHLIWEENFEGDVSAWDIQASEGAVLEIAENSYFGQPTHSLYMGEKEEGVTSPYAQRSIGSWSEQLEVSFDITAPYAEAGDFGGDHHPIVRLREDSSTKVQIRFDSANRLSVWTTEDSWNRITNDADQDWVVWPKGSNTEPVGRITMHYDSEGFFTVTAPGREPDSGGPFSLTLEAEPDLNLDEIRIQSQSSSHSWVSPEGDVYLDNFEVRTIPEPGSVALLGLSAGALLIRRRRQAHA